MIEGYSIAEAARRTGHSESTIRRRVRDGDLVVVPASKPTRLNTTSVEEERGRVLRDLGAIDDGASAPVNAEIESLKARVRELSGALADLTAAHSSLLDTFRRLSDEAVPNH